MAVVIEGIGIPDSKLAREATELVRDTESPILFHHSSRVFYWGAMTGVRRCLTFDAELIYVGAMFHDMGLTRQTLSRRSSTVSGGSRKLPLATSRPMSSPTRTRISRRRISVA
jgi:HD superfamily phosphodiesterase